MPIVVIGYDLVMRSISLRTRLRVGTHFLGVPGEGYSSAALAQLAMRFAGRTVEVSSHQTIRVSLSQRTQSIVVLDMVAWTNHAVEPMYAMSCCCQSLAIYLLR